MTANIIINLEALASGFGKQDEYMLYNFYSFAINELKTLEEKELFYWGALAMFADLGKMRVRRVYYTWRFRQEFKKLQGVDQ